MTQSLETNQRVTRTRKIDVFQRLDTSNFKILRILS